MKPSVIRRTLVVLLTVATPPSSHYTQRGWHTSEFPDALPRSGKICFLRPWRHSSAYSYRFYRLTDLFPSNPQPIHFLYPHIKFLSSSSEAQPSSEICYTFTKLHGVTAQKRVITQFYVFLLQVICHICLMFGLWQQNKPKQRQKEAANCCLFVSNIRKFWNPSFWTAYVPLYFSVCFIN